MAIDFEFGRDTRQRETGLRSIGPAILQASHELLCKSKRNAAAQLVSRDPIIADHAKDLLVHVNHAETGADIRLRAPYAVAQFVHALQGHTRGREISAGGQSAKALARSIGREVFDLGLEPIAEIIAVGRAIGFSDE